MAGHTQQFCDFSSQSSIVTADAIGKTHVYSHNFNLSKCWFVEGPSRTKRDKIVVLVVVVLHSMPPSRAHTIWKTLTTWV